MQLQHPQLIDSLKKAYSAEKAAAFAYQGHAASVKSSVEKAAIRQIELDEWNHRKEVLQLMDQYGIQPSKYYEFRFHIVGKVISMLLSDNMSGQRHLLPSLSIDCGSRSICYRVCSKCRGRDK